MEKREERGKIFCFLIFFLFSLDTDKTGNNKAGGGEKRKGKRKMLRNTVEGQEKGKEKNSYFFPRFLSFFLTIDWCRMEGKDVENRRLTA